MYSHSYWLVIFCTTNSSRVLARKRWLTFEKSWKKTQYLLNTLYIHSSKFNFSSGCPFSVQLYAKYNTYTRHDMIWWQVHKYFAPKNLMLRFSCYILVWSKFQTFNYLTIYLSICFIFKGYICKVTSSRHMAQFSILLSIAFI